MNAITMYISHKAIDRPRVVLVIALIVIVISLLAAWFIPVQRAPAINTAIIMVTVPYPGAQPSEVEERITRKIEDAFQRLEDVDDIFSMSMRGSSVLSVIFLDGVSSEKARADVEHLVNEVRRELPMGREVQPIITTIDFESVPIMLVNMSGPEGFDERTLKRIAEDVQDELEAIPGVSNTQLFGGREREIHVDVNPDLFAEYGLEIGQIRQALLNHHSEMPGGSLDTAQYDYQIRNETKFRDLDDIRDVAVAEHEGRVVRIDDIARVSDTYRRLRNTALLDGQSTATIIVNKESNINTLGTARAIKARVEELREQYPHIDFSTTRDISEDIALMFRVLGQSALCGAVLILFILTFALGIRISMLVILAIPFTTAVALVFLFGAGIPISNMVIFSFILVLGMVVDGAIIVAENIHRHIERGEPPIVAAKVGIDEVGIPVIAADLTTVAAFLPMLLIPGIMGDFMGVMPRVVSVALLGSVLVDHFLIPAIAAYWYKQQTPVATGKPRPGRISRMRPNRGPFTRAYGMALRWGLNHRWAVMACCALALVWAGLTLREVGATFFPKSDRGQFEINFELPLGYSIHETLRASEVFTGPLEELRDKKELVHFVTAIGSSAGLASRLDSDPATGPEFGKIMVQLEPPTDRERSQGEILEELREKIEANPWPGMVFRIEELKEGPPGGFDVAVRLTGKDLDQLGDMAAKLVARLRRIEGLVDPGTDYRPASPELVVEPYPEVVGLFGMTEAQVAGAIQTAILGDNTIELSMDDEDVALRLQIDPEYQKHKEGITGLMLTGPSGRKATVGQLAEIRRGTGLYAINRYQRHRSVTVRANIKADSDLKPDDVFAVLRRDCLPAVGFRPVKGEAQTLLGEMRDDLLPKLGVRLPQPPATNFLGNPVTEAEGIRAQFTGQNEERDKNFEYLSSVMIIGVVLIFGVLVIQFNSFRQTVIVLMAVPLSFVGVVFGMWICGDPFSTATFIGLVALAGIVVNDAIVMVDFTNQARRRGMRVKHALIEAGVNRLRPVLLTTVTTIGGLLPLFLNLSGGAEFWQPLTGAVIFGLAFATVLTLLVIPVAYSLVYTWADR